MGADPMSLLPQPWPWLLVAWLGACLGSFANVLIHRLPRNQSVVRPRSRCPGCAHPIAWHDNLPVLGWLLLRGRCRHCGAPIPRRYPLVELLGAAALVVGVWRFGWGWGGFAAGLFLIDLLAIALIDWEHMIIPHTLTVGGMALGVALAPWTGLGIGGALAGLAAGAGLVLALAHGYRLLRGQVGMGGGDVMLMGMVGAFLGLRGVVVVIFGGALLGTLFAVVRHGGRLSGQSRLPFGTFLALAAAAALFAGRPLVDWYLGLLA
jgi:leader peptidase (prepilin peptidase)/N-methyltransferase